MTLRDAFGDLWRRRPCTWPNDGFMASLIDLELATRGQTSSLELAEYVAWGDYEGPAEGEALPVSVLPRLMRKDTCLDAEQRAREAELEDQLAKLQLGALPSTADRTNGGDVTRRFSLCRKGRQEQARKMSGEARSGRSGSSPSTRSSTASTTSSS